VLCIRGYIFTSPPPVCQYDRGGGVPLSPVESGGEARLPEMTVGVVLINLSFVNFIISIFTCTLIKVIKLNMQE
jgi:hypothetical protein